MADLKQLIMVKEMATNKERAALQAFSASQQQMTQLQQQKSSLEEYKLDYMRQMIEQGKQGLSAAKLGLLQGFLAKIDSSITQQLDVIVRAQLAVDARKVQWQQSLRYLDSINFLINKQQQEYQEIQDKQQQKLSDEFAMMAHYRKIKRSS
ncbi:MAG: flagellar export protein FliJ [Gammaproteobacteria bacterium]|nr:flagellar export protein FliJ [Gammaproteobacteria bacterium]